MKQVQFCVIFFCFYTFLFNLGKYVNKWKKILFSLLYLTHMTSCIIGPFLCCHLLYLIIYLKLTFSKKTHHFCIHRWLLWMTLITLAVSSFFLKSGSASSIWTTSRRYLLYSRPRFQSSRVSFCWGPRQQGSEYKY